MKKLLLLIALLIVCSQTAFSQITAAISVDESNNLVYPLDGRVYITNTNAELRFSGAGSTLNVTNDSTNGTITADDVVVRDLLTVTNTATFRTNTFVGGSLTVTNTTLLRSNTTISGTLTVTNAATFNTNVSIAGNLTNSGTFTNTGAVNFGNTLTVAGQSTFNTNVGIGISNNSVRLHVRDVAGPTNNIPPALALFDMVVVENYTPNGGATINLWANPTNGRSEIGFSSGTNRVKGLISYLHDVDQLRFSAGLTEVFRLESNNVTSLTNFTVNGTSTFNANVNMTNSAGALVVTVDDLFIKDILTVTNAATFRSTVNLANPGTAASNAVRADRAITNGDGLIGGGDLTTDRILAVDASVVRTNNTNQTIAGTKTFSNVTVNGALNVGTNILAVTNGGTGTNTFTAAGVLVGNGTGAVGTITGGITTNFSIRTLSTNNTSNTSYVTNAIIISNGIITQWTRTGTAL